MAAHAPRINLRLWINMLRRAGWSARSAEEVAEQLDAELQHSASGEALKDLELRLIRHIDGRAPLTTLSGQRNPVPISIEWSAESPSHLH